MSEEGRFFHENHPCLPARPVIFEHHRDELGGLGLHYSVGSLGERYGCDVGRRRLVLAATEETSGSLTHGRGRDCSERG